MCGAGLPRARGHGRVPLPLTPILWSCAQGGLEPTVDIIRRFPLCSFTCVHVVPGITIVRAFVLHFTTLGLSQGSWSLLGTRHEGPEHLQGA